MRRPSNAAQFSDVTLPRRCNPHCSCADASWRTNLINAHALLHTPSVCKCALVCKQPADVFTPKSNPRKKKDNFKRPRHNKQDRKKVASSEKQAYLMQMCAATPRLRCRDFLLERSGGGIRSSTRDARDAEGGLGSAGTADGDSEESTAASLRNAARRDNTGKLCAPFDNADGPACTSLAKRPRRRRKTRRILHDPLAAAAAQEGEKETDNRYFHSPLTPTSLDWLLPSLALRPIPPFPPHTLFVPEISPKGF